jgi:hypothetical protein
MDLDAEAFCLFASLFAEVLRYRGIFWDPNAWLDGFVSHRIVWLRIMFLAVRSFIGSE